MQDQESSVRGQVIIMRGVSGAGKSTLAKGLIKQINAARVKEKKEPLSSAVHSTDSYFYDGDGNYCFNPSDLSWHHAKNLKAFCLDLETGIDLVVCDNTNIKQWEFERYVAAARREHYSITVIELRCDPDVAHARCVHGVPSETVHRMNSELEPLESLR